jgi:hypothetical protein
MPWVGSSPLGQHGVGMPPPGVPAWLYPSAVLYTRVELARGDGGTANMCWVEEVTRSAFPAEGEGEFSVVYRPLWSSGEGDSEEWGVGGPYPMPLPQFLDLIVLPEGDGIRGYEVRYLPHLSRDTRVRGINRPPILRLGEANRPYQAAYGSRSTEQRLCLLGLYLELYSKRQILLNWKGSETPEGAGAHLAARLGVEEMLKEMAKKLGLNEDSIERAHLEAWQALGDMLKSPPGPQEPRSRFEREPPV